ncbi:MAG: hypothetical protein ACREPR_07760 [Brasilonema sp.]
MTALKAVQPSRTTRPTLRRHQHRRQPYSQAHKAMATEITVKLCVNGILAVTAIAALIKLLPYHFSQQTKLQEIRLEVSEVEERVNRLRGNFNRNLDTRQTKKLMEEQSPRLAPNQRRIFWAPSSESKK